MSLIIPAVAMLLGLLALGHDGGPPVFAADGFYSACWTSGPFEGVEYDGNQDSGPYKEGWGSENEFVIDPRDSNNQIKSQDAFKPEKFVKAFRVEGCAYDGPCSGAFVESGFGSLFSSFPEAIDYTFAANVLGGGVAMNGVDRLNDRDVNDRRMKILARFLDPSYLSLSVSAG